MKIYGTTTTGPISGTDALSARLGKNRPQVGPQTTRTEPGGSEIRVSKEAMRLAAQAPASFDAVRVDRLRDAHATGDLHVDASAIASRLAQEN